MALSRKQLRAVLVSVAALTVLLTSMGTDAQAATPAPAWSLTVTSYPTVFPEKAESSPYDLGPGYFVVATNVGGAASNAPFTITTKLGDGLESSANSPTRIRFIPGGETQSNCTVLAEEVSCEGTELVPPGASATASFPVNVDASAPEITAEVEIVGGGAVKRVSRTTTSTGSVPPPFGLLNGSAGLYTNATSADGSVVTSAGGRPFQATVGIGFPSRKLFEESALYSVAEPKDIRATLPRGFSVNPQATETLCTESQLESDITTKGEEAGGCPPSSQIGIATSNVVFGPPQAYISPIFNMVPPPGVPAALGFDVTGGVYVHLLGHVRSNGEYELSADSFDTPAKLQVLGASVSLWGNPTDPAHDSLRGIACFGASGLCPHPVEPRSTALLTLPGDCSGSPLVTSAEVDSWRSPGTFSSGTATSADLDNVPVSLSGCEALEFQPSVSAASVSKKADSPTGFDFNLHQTQKLGFDELGNTPLKEAAVTLPEGVTLNPSGANGLDSCSEAEIGRLPDVAGHLRFSEDPQTCPSASKVGTVEVTTPLLSQTLNGSIFVAKPYENPFGSLLAIYLAVEDEQSGITAKLAGKVEADPRTGQLTGTFTESPELPLEDIDLHFFEGSTAALKNPLACGSTKTLSTLTPWSNSAGQTKQIEATSEVNVSASGGLPCPTSEANAPASPGFNAGTVTPKAATYSPFVLNISRADGEQRLERLSATLPEGLLGRLAGIPYCSESQIAEARKRETTQQGQSEIANPSCPVASQVGTVTIGAGAGTSPYYVQGKVYLAGPYKGAPLSLVVITPAVAGPFDLGVVVTRVALQVDEFSAQIHAVSDSLPSILDGIPLDLRTVSLKIDKPQFVLNPTNCEPRQVVGEVFTSFVLAKLSSRFQVGGCNALKFDPKIKLRVKGATARSGHPSLTAVVTYPSNVSSANIARAQIGLPHAEFLDQGNLNKVCTRANLATDSCPANSVYGFAKAWSPLLAKPLEGPVYLAVGFGYKLPALVADLNGQIRVLLKGKVDTTKANGIRTTFEAVPDAPVSRFMLHLKGGKKYGLLENSEQICQKPQRAGVRLLGQNQVVDKFMVRIQTPCGR